MPVYDDFPDLTIKAVPLVCKEAIPECGGAVQSAASLAAPERVLRTLLILFPGTARVSILPYDGEVDVTSAAKARLSDDQCKGYATLGPDRTPAEADQRQARDTRSCRESLVDHAVDVWRISNRRTARATTSCWASTTTRRPRPSARSRPCTEPGWSRGGRTIAPGQTPMIFVNEGRPMSAAHEFGHALGFPHADSDVPGGL